MSSDCPAPDQDQDLVVCNGSQEDFRRMLAELEKDIAEAERLLKVEEQEPR